MGVCDNVITQPWLFVQSKNISPLRALFVPIWYWCAEEVVARCFAKPVVATQTALIPEELRVVERVTRYVSQ
jgi:hypothetical protein